MSRTASVDNEHPSAGPVKHPPMLTQYLRYKREHLDAVLFFQVGDFFELFFDDAVTVARALNLTLTTRDKNSPTPVPMCGVPVGVIDGYLERLVALGFSAALVVQREQAPGARGMFERRLERIVTPGVRVMGAAPGRSEAPIVAAVSIDSDRDAAVAWCEVEQGRVFVRDAIPLAELRQEIARLGPVEIVLPSSLDRAPVDRRVGWVRSCESVVGTQALKFRSDLRDANKIREFGAIPGYAVLAPVAKHAVRLLLGYIDETTVHRALAISEIVRPTMGDTLIIDATTRTNLELVRTMRGGSVQGSLLGYLDQTRSAGGSRLLRSWVMAPSAQRGEIAARSEVVAWLRRESSVREQMQEYFGKVADLDRLSARIELGVVTPRECGALRDTLELLPEFCRLCLQVDANSVPERAQAIAAELACECVSRKRLRETLVDAPPPTTHEGAIIREGFDKEIDRLREAHNRGRDWILAYEAEEREATGISSLKVKYNNVIGYFIEVTKSHLSKVPERFLRRQHTAQGERFTTERLKGLEAEVSSAEARLLRRERELFEMLRSELRTEIDRFRRCARALNELDVLAAFAELGERERLTRPELTDSLVLELSDAWHPVIAQHLEGRFVPNSLQLSDDGARTIVLTGPNMGGKSTYLRQAALCVIMAQIGCDVPAARATIGMVDRIFARIGASDDLAEGDSTFMVEMREAAHIVRSASERSLVLVDEIGRGTATADGLAIAQAILEWIATHCRCRTLFATHFHELTALENQCAMVKNFSVGSHDDQGRVVFTHVIEPGPASRSYGLEVAELAGLPSSLLDRARKVLRDIESAAPRKNATSPQIAMFGGSSEQARERPPADYAMLKQVAQRIRESNGDETTPRRALELLFDLQKLLQVGSRGGPSER